MNNPDKIDLLAHRLQSLPKLLDAALKQSPRNDNKVSFLRKECFNIIAEADNILNNDL